MAPGVLRASFPKLSLLSKSDCACFTKVQQRNFCVQDQVCTGEMHRNAGCLLDLVQEKYLKKKAQKHVQQVGDQIGAKMCGR